LQLFSNYEVASYLGLAPQSLSRIRNHDWRYSRQL
jgi:hypothetical protein